MNGEYYYKRAVCFDRRKKYRSAQTDFQKSIALHYRPGEAYFTMGLEEMSGNDTAAISYFQKSLTSDPDKKEEVEPLIKACRLELELENSEAAKEFADIKPKKQKAKSVKTKAKRHQPKKFQTDITRR
jgi:tetratricopeptide (TPR) repeat protein